MFTVICCNGYYLVGKTATKDEAMALALSHTDGTYDCFIRDSSGKMIGDKSGWYEDTSEYYRDAATQTGMYDGW